MRADVEKIMKEYGQHVTLRRGGEARSTCAFLQPAVKQAETVPEEMCSFGALDSRRWIYLGQEEVCPGEQILWGQQCFRVRSSRSFPVGEDVLYWWASLEQEREVAE
jgi:hypothetical protein